MSPPRSSSSRVSSSQLTPPKPRAISVTPRQPSGRTSKKAVQQALPISVESSRRLAREYELPTVVSCGGCENRWTDLDAAHCRACHQNWDAVRDFDDHLPECPAGPEIAPRRPKRLANAAGKDGSGKSGRSSGKGGADKPPQAAREEQNVA